MLWKIASFDFGENFKLIFQLGQIQNTDIIRRLENRKKFR